MLMLSQTYSSMSISGSTSADFVTLPSLCLLPSLVLLLVAPPWLQAALYLLMVSAPKVLIWSSVPHGPRLRTLPTLMRLGGLLLQPTDPSILVATVHIRVSKPHHCLLSQKDFGEDFVDKVPKQHYCWHFCVCHCGCVPGCSLDVPWRGPLEKRGQQETWENPRTEKQRCSWWAGQHRGLVGVCGSWIWM